MQYLLQLFFDICRLRRGPQDVPAAGSLFVLLLTAGILFDTMTYFFELSFFESFYFSALINLILLAVMALLLQIMGYAARILQTLTAMLGVSLIISVLHFPVWVMIVMEPNDPGLFGFIHLIFLLWSLTVNSHILRHALSIPVFPASVLSIGYLMLNYIVAGFLFPQAG